MFLNAHLDDREEFIRCSSPIGENRNPFFSSRKLEVLWNVCLVYALSIALKSNTAKRGGAQNDSKNRSGCLQLEHGYIIILLGVGASTL